MRVWTSGYNIGMSAIFDFFDLMGFLGAKRKSGHKFWKQFPTQKLPGSSFLWGTGAACIVPDPRGVAVIGFDFAAPLLRSLYLESSN